MIRRYLISGCVALALAGACGAVMQVPAVAQALGMDPVARGLAVKAQTTAAGAMPKTGGTFSGAVALGSGVRLSAGTFSVISDLGARFDNAAGSLSWAEITSGGLLLDSANGVLNWGTVSSFTKDAGISRLAAGSVGIGNGTQGDVSGSIQAAKHQVGSGTALTLAAGELGFNKITASGSAAGASGGKMELVCGTNAGSAKLIAYAGTSTTPVTILDNIGSGVTGC